MSTVSRIAVILFLAPVIALTENSPVRIEGTYGSLRYIEEAGDVVGIVVTVTRQGGGFEVSYQMAEGQPGDIYHVAAVVMGNTISFQLPPMVVAEMNGGKLVGTKAIPRPPYHGRITSRGLKGGFAGEDHEFLPRQRDVDTKSKGK
jgi:hypothetical protein